MAETLAPLRATLDSAVATSDRRQASLLGCATFVFLTAAGAAHGGYFPGSWGWLTLAAAWAALMALVFDERAGLSREGTLFAGALAAYTVWSLLSAWWSVDVTGTVLEAQRNLVYVAAVTATLLLARNHAATIVVAAWAASVALCSYALLTRLVPDRFGVVDPISGYRLSEPVGYWNSLGLLAAAGALLGLGLAARSASRTLRVLGATSVPILATTLYFTFSRGAWGSLIAGAVVLVALDPRRLQALWWALLAVPAAAVAVLLAVDRSALSTAGASLSAQTHEGHQLLAWLVIAGAITAVIAAGWIVLEPRVAVHAAPYRGRAELALVALVAVGALATFAVAGAPWTLTSRAWHSFESAPPAGTGNLSGRLFHLSSNGRIAQWKIARHEFTAHPLAGSGAGTFERYWNEQRAQGGKVRNVHNLYLEAAATLGVIGLALLALALAVPLAVLARARRSPLAPFATAALVAYLVHAVVDWDWQVTGVTLPVLVCAAAFCTTGARPLAGRVRVAGYSVAVVVALAGLWGIGMQTTLSRIDSGSLAHAAAAARHASDLQPWSTEPWRRLAERDIDAGQYAGARAALHKALAKDTGDWSLWFDLARASGGAVRAAALDHAEALNPKSPEVAAFRATLTSLSSIGSGQ